MDSLRVWWITNPPREPELYPVNNIEEAMAKLRELEKRDLADDLIDCNAGGLEVLEEGEWTEYYDVKGMDIDEIMKEE